MAARFVCKVYRKVGQGLLTSPPPPWLQGGATARSSWLRPGCSACRLLLGLLPAAHWRTTAAACGHVVVFIVDVFIRSGCWCLHFLASVLLHCCHVIAVFQQMLHDQVFRGF